MAADVTTIHHDNIRYFSQVLDLVMKHTEEDFGPYKLIPHDYDENGQRMRLTLIKKRNLDVFWSTSTTEREQYLRPVRFNLMRNLNHYRFLLIRKGESEHYQGIKTLPQLRQYTFGSGTHWSDTAILEDNELSLTTAIKHNNLFRMLKAQRFDFMARGAYEVWTEIEDYKEDFELHPTLMLRYPINYYFFVRPEDEHLAHRLQVGLERAAVDGSLDALFFSEPNYKRGWDEVHSGKYHIITLDSEAVTGVPASHETQTPTRLNPMPLNPSSTLNPLP